MTTDNAPDFDQVEDLARSLAREAGADFDAPRAKRKHWRDKAIAELDALGSRRVGQVSEFTAGLAFGTLGTLFVVAVASAAWVALT